MPSRLTASLLAALLLAGPLAAADPPARPDVVVAEGEAFTPAGGKGWKVTGQNDTYGSHTYGGMWMTHGGCLGAAADVEGAVATQAVTVPKAGKYRVWSKYQAPPYFACLHRVEVVQGGKVVFTHDYGKPGTDRLWSFSGESDELWWPWGVDHDTAESPAKTADLAAGPAEIRLTALANPRPAADRYVDFVLLTTNPANDYQGFKPMGVGTPFANEALAASKLYARFKNTSDKPAKLVVERAGHFQPQYGGGRAEFPDAPVAPGEWSPWFNVGPFCRLVHDEGLWLTLPGAAKFPVRFSRDADGKTNLGEFDLPSGDAVHVPIDITWRPDADVRPSRERAEQLIRLSSRWRTANGGKKPKEILFFGAFAARKGQEDWVFALKDRLGYNTQLPAPYERAPRDLVAQHFGSIEAVRGLAKTLKEPERLKVVSFGDEIGLGKINFKDPKLNEKFRGWLVARKVTAADLGIEPAAANLTDDSDPRLVWYSNLFNEEETAAGFRATTEEVRKLFGPEVLTGANYSPHHLALCYGPVHQWVDLFKNNGMSMFWAEDYVFSVPEVPQMQSWMLAEARCATKYNRQPIHFYIMPHAPGQEAGFLRRNTLLTAGSGARHIDNFWVGPAENFTENYVSWGATDTFRTLHEVMYDTAEAEPYLVGGSQRPARVAVVLSKATDFHESRLMVDKDKDAFARRCKNAPPKVNQILGRKEQQYLYLALKHAGHAVDLITEDDIAGGALKQYEAIYTAGEWLDARAVAKLEEWVRDGGTLQASAGLGLKDQFDRPQPAMLGLLGLKDATAPEKSVAVVRTLLELPLLPVIDTLDTGGKKVPAVAWRQRLTPGEGARPLATWGDGSAAVTERTLGKGKVVAAGTMIGAAWLKTGLPAVPFARGGVKAARNPESPSADAGALVARGAAGVKRDVVCSLPGVEAVVADGPKGTVVTLVNWTNAPMGGLRVSVRLPAKPKEARSVAGQKPLASEYADGAVSFTLDLDDADYVLLSK